MSAPSCSAAVERIPAGFNRNGTFIFLVIRSSDSARDVQPLREMRWRGLGINVGASTSRTQNAIESHSNGYNGAAAEEAAETGRGRSR